MIFRILYELGILYCKFISKLIDFLLVLDSEGIADLSDFIDGRFILDDLGSGRKPQGGKSLVIVY